MNMLRRIDSSYPIDKLLPFCKHALSDSRPGAQNMSPVNWETNNASFLYLLYIEKRYDGNCNGYFIHERDNTILCGNGFSASDLDPKMTHLNSRCYTIPGVQLPRIHGEITDLIVDISIREGQQGAYTSFNDYNKRLVDGYMYINEPSSHKRYFMENGKHYARPGVRIHPMTKGKVPYLLKGTKQWIIYMIWEESYRETFESMMHNLRWTTQN